jgi:hypothetical protein
MNITFKQTKGIVLPKGTYVKLTKVASKLPSDVKVGSVSKGRITNSTGLQCTHSLQLDDKSNTSTVIFIQTTEAGDYIIGTITSIYFLQVL